MVKINGSSFALQYKRTTGRPIDSTETFKTLEDATSYARNTDAEEYFPYAGQIISVEIGEGVYKLVKDDSISEEDGRKHYRLSPIITEEESGNKYLSKIEDDEARGLITFLAGINVKIKAVIQKLIAEDATFSKEISSKDYVQNLLGWMITPEGHIDAKSLRLRDFLEVPELRYNRVSIVSGEEWNAPGGGIIESVDAVNKTVHLKLEPGEVSQVEIDDICKGVFNNDTGFQTAYFRITEKIDNASYKYVLRSGYTFNPCKAMHFVAYGNFTNAERQKSCYSTQNYIRFLKGVNNWEITKDMIAMQLGDLSNLKLFGIDMSGHSAYLNRVYMTGTIRQISSDGVTEAPVPVFKGKWKSGTYWYYDEVTHNGSTWICIESTTTQEPSDSSTDWLKVVSEGRPGDDGTSLVFKGEFASAPSNPHNGWYYRNTTDKKCYVYQDGAWHLMTEDGKPGADGAGSISAILDDGMQSVSCNSSGAVISGLPLTTTFSMYYGTTKLALDSLTVGSITGVTSSANKSTGVVTVSAITAAASDTIRIPVTGKASYKDAQYERTVYLSVNKVKPGSDGENAIIYSLQPSVNVIKKNADGSSEVSKISCRIMKTDGASTVVSSLPAGYSMDYVIDSGTANGYTPGSDVAVSGITTKIQFRLYSETSGVVLVDQQTIVVLKDGSNGKPGADGAGSISAILDDGMQSVSCNSSGAVISGLPLTTTFSMYYGTTKLALDSLTVGSITGVTSSANKSTGVVTVSAITAAASDTIRIPVTGKASYKDAQYERTVYLSVNKVKPGSDGENAIIYSLQPSVNVIKKNADGSSEVSKISCRIMKTDGASTVVSSLPAGYSMDYVIDSGTANGYTPGSDVAVSGITTKIQFRLYSETSGVVLVDQQTIVVLKDGSNGKPGDDGVGIKDVDVLFYLSSSATSLIGGSWSTTSPTWVNGKYIWSKTRIIYTNTTTWESDPTCISGGKGENGLGIKSVIEEYYLSTSSSSLIGGSWSTSTPAWVNGKYIWTRTVITYTDSSSTTTDAICVTGAKGDTGIGVKSISGQYYLSTSYSITTGGSWSTTVPAWQDGKYIWTRSVITYTDNSYTETKPVCVTGGKGPSGNDGKGVKSFGILYYLSTSSSSLVGGSWSTTPPTWQNGKYLWSKTKVTYTDDSTWESDPVCITGSQGQTGLPGAMLRPRGVWAANTEYYHNDAFIDTVIYNGQNKLCKITHTSTSSFDSTKWEEFSEFVNVATNVLLAQNATIDVLGTSGIFVGNLEKTEGWLMTEGSIKHNQTGVELTADGKISLPESGGMTVGGKTFIEAGKIKTEFINVDTLEVTKLKGATGTFKELQAIDNAGKIQGKISFNTEGSGDNVSSSFNIDFSKTWISGDLYQQGYNSEEGRSWRFYTSDLWCRGEFGHRVMTTIKVFADNDWNFYVHIYGYGSDNNVDRYPQSGQPIDCIVMEGNGNYVLRICDSATFKKVTVVNSSDYPKRVVYNQPSSLTYTIEPWKFVTFVTADIAKTSPPYYVNNLFIK